MKKFFSRVWNALTYFCPGNIEARRRERETQLRLAEQQREMDELIALVQNGVKKLMPEKPRDKRVKPQPIPASQVLGIPASEVPARAALVREESRVSYTYPRGDDRSTVRNLQKHNDRYHKRGE